MRFLVGDTGPNFDLSNAEVNYELTLVYPPPSSPPPNGNFLPAAYCADAIAALYKSQVDKKVGDLSISYSQKAKQYNDIAIRLRSRATIAGVVTYFGGISLATKIANDLNMSIVNCAVRIDGMDFWSPLKTWTGGGGQGSYLGI